MDLNQQRLEIEQFLLDVRQHIRASLETSEYENTSNLFHVTEAKSSLQLLQKCEQLLEKFADKNHNNANRNCNGTSFNSKGDKYINNSKQLATTTTTTTADVDVVTLSNGNVGGGDSTNESQHEDDSYLDMTANKKFSASKEYTALNNSTQSDKTFRCSTRGNETSDGDGDDSTDDRPAEAQHETAFDEDPQIYDVCQVTSVDADETQRANLTSEREPTQLVDCPYQDLPAGHLSIQRSIKYGQLQRIEKRLFFDQSKKCYCGILNDWLLCYADGPTAARPNLTLHLKSHGIEIEHSGEGKRRDVCFQITTADPNKKFTFQANNEVDAKEWIHAIEAAIRGDCATVLKNPRKLPTPPLMKRMTFISNGGKGVTLDPNQTDSIYEEPSPLYHVHEPTDRLIAKNEDEKSPPPTLPDKQNSANAMAKKYEYDVPKCPAQPLKTVAEQTEIETTGLLISGESRASNPPNLTNNSCSTATIPTSRPAENVDFQLKVKDVHSKLSSHLSAGLNLQKKPLKKASSNVSSTSDAAEPNSLLNVTPSPPSAKEIKKHRKSSTPSPATPKTASIGKPNGSHSGCHASGEKSAKNWFLNRLNKTTSSTRSSTCSIPSPAKCKQSEKENLLSNLETGDCYDGTDSNPASPILKSSASSAVGVAKSKVNMIINQFESSGHLAMFSVEAFAENAVATFNSFCDNDCNSYEPIMAISTPPSSFMKKV